MKRRVTLAIGAAAAVAGITAAAVPAHASPRPASWEQRTCTAFTAWQRHPTAGRLVTLGTDSLHVPWKWLGSDVWQLINDVHAQPKYASDDATSIWQDCHNGYGL